MGLSRISKLFVDRDEMSDREALARRRDHRVTLICGACVGASYTLQLAVLTAARLAERCFPGAVRVILDDALAASSLLLWPSLRLTFGQALLGVLGTSALGSRHDHDGDGVSIVFGDAVAPRNALRVTFDGWIAATGPAAIVERLPESEFCALSGVLGASLAVSEIFMSFAGISIEATRRSIARSLWRPEGDVRDPSARGVPVQFLPSELWVLGLGHLGNAYLWTLAALPYRDPGQVEIFLTDFDWVEADNLDTGLLFTAHAKGQYKTRFCGAWLEERGFRTRLIERRFDGHFRCGADEPRLALCGFDTNVARRPLATADFVRVFESGLGATADNFDAIRVHALPNPRSVLDLWPDTSSEEQEAEVARRTRVARHSPAYAALGRDECGRFELAGKSVAVPFVGATAACFVIAEAIRLFHDGPAYADVSLRLGTPGEVSSTSLGTYTVQDTVQLSYAPSK